MESGIRHNAYLNYEPDTLPYSLGIRLATSLILKVLSLIQAKKCNDIFDGLCRMVMFLASLLMYLSSVELYDYYLDL